MAKKKPTGPKADPEVEAALANLGGGGAAFTDPPGDGKTLEEANNLAPVGDQPHVNRKHYDRQIRTRLEGEELQQANMELLNALDEVDKQELAKKAVMEEWKEVLKYADKNVDYFRALIREGKVETVRVEEFKDFDQGTVKIFRLDTQEVLEERPLGDNERQRELSGMDAESTPTPSDAGQDLLDAVEEHEAQEKAAPVAGLNIDLPSRPQLAEE